MFGEPRGRAEGVVSALSLCILLCGDVTSKNPKETGVLINDKHSAAPQGLRLTSK